MSQAALGALVGLAAAGGLVLLGSHLASRRRPALLDRIGPYVPTLRPIATSTRPSSRGVGLLTGRPADQARRRTRSGQPSLEQVTWAGFGACFGAALGVALAARGSAGGAVLVLGVVGAAAGLFARDRAVARRARRRRTAMVAELPTLADLVALAVTSGAGPVAALDRASAVLAGPLAAEVQAGVAEIRSGAAVEPALRAVSARVDIAPVDRFLDALLLAQERGAPLADVARAQAIDARAGQRRHLLELAGRKDALMLVPIVALVLPSVVIVAAFPGLATLRLVVP